MKLKHLLLILALAPLASYAITTGVGSSVEVSKLTGTVVQTGKTVETHQGIEVSVAKQAGTNIEQIGKYNSSAIGTSSFKGNLVDVTTTTKSFSFFDQ
jgi:hypothetical protein